MTPERLAQIAQAHGLTTRQNANPSRIHYGVPSKYQGFSALATLFPTTQEVVGMASLLLVQCARPTDWAMWRRHAAHYVRAEYKQQALAFLSNLRKEVTP